MSDHEVDYLVFAYDSVGCSVVGHCLGMGRPRGDNDVAILSRRH